MTSLRHRVYQAIRYGLSLSPALAARIEAAAVEAQGRNPAEIGHYRDWKKYQGMDLAEVFTNIYAEGRWGADDGDGYFSGSGTRTDAIAGAYVTAIREFAGKFASPPDVVDLGCGDFHIGAQLRSAFGSYTACDVVPGLIERNRRLHGALDVDFRCLDITTQDLPRCEVVMVRQVLQHLSNRDITGFVSRIAGVCRWLVVTEHWPALDGFVANIDKPTGAEIRLGLGSGVVLTQAPFNLHVEEAHQLCAVTGEGGVIVTMAYKMPI